MTHIDRTTTALAPSAQDATASLHTPEAGAFGGARSVNRVIGEVRRGVPVILQGGAGDDAGLVLLPIETATEATLAEFAAIAAGPAAVLLAPGRARSLAGFGDRQGNAALIVETPPNADLDALRILADPSHGGLAPGSALRETAAIDGGMAEAALTLAKLARLLPAMLAAPWRAPGPDALPSDLLSALASDVRAYPASVAGSLARMAEARVPLAEASSVRVVAFRPPDGGIEHLAIVIGSPETSAGAPLVRIHSECFTGDLLGSLRCDCGPQLHQAIRLMEAEGAGVILYMAHEGRGIGLVNKLRAYQLQDSGLDTLDANKALGYGADERNFAEAALMLKTLGIAKIRLLTNNPDKVAALEAAGIAVDDRISITIDANGVNNFYLATKARRFGHLLG